MPTNKSGDLSIKLLSMAFLLLVWQSVAYYINNDLLPGPITVLSSLWKHLVEDDLLLHLSITLLRVAISFFIAFIIGTIAGIVMGNYPKIDSALDSLLIIGLNIPALVTIILCYVWFGLNELAAICAVVVNKIPVVVVTVREGARAIDRKLLQVGNAFNLNRRQVLLKIYIPQLYPYLIAAARSGLSLIWKIVLVVELLGRSNGVGFKLGTFFQFFDITSILVYTLAFAAVVLITENGLVQPIESRLNRWRL
ncbi:MAG: ABC transporter permease subunit [Proteobacteria bacterium]|nr:ABC transporter permease subunit [Pseudomonadota bacterium]